MHPAAAVDTRELTGPDCLRAETRDGRRIIAGTFARYGTLSATLRETDSRGVMRTFRERIEPGAFTRSITSRPIVALANHQKWPPLGSTQSGSLRLSETADGVDFELDAPDTPAGNEAFAVVARGDHGGMSFGFGPGPNGSSWERDESGGLIHVLRDVELYEISIVTWPAYPGTAAAAVRSLEEWEAADRAAKESTRSEKSGPTVEILIGPIASGKSSYTRTRADAGALAVNLDSIITAMHAGAYRYDDTIADAYRAAAAGTLRAALAAGRDVVIDETHTTRKARARSVAAVREAQPTARIVAVSFPMRDPATHARRRAADDARGHSEAEWTEIARRQIAAAEPVTDSEGFDETRDMSQWTPPTAAAARAAALAAKWNQVFKAK